MKPGITSAVCLNSLILGAALLLTGCATTGNQRSANTRATMKDVEQVYIRSSEQVDVTRGSLEGIVNPNQPDEKKAFDRYSNDVSKMGNLEKRLNKQGDQMRVQQKDYFEEWRMQGNTYTNPRIQALSEQRRADLTAVFANIAESSVGVKGALKAYMSDLRQIRTYLSTDLTPKGIESITPTVQQAIVDGDNLKEAIKPVLSSMDDARGELAQGPNR